MDIGNNCRIDDKWIPKNVSTGMFDIKGKEIKTSNKITLNGCTSREAIVGKTEKEFVLFFGLDIGSCMWQLDTELINKHKVQVMQDM